MPIYPAGSLVTYIDPSNNTHGAILQNEVDTDSNEREANFSLWSVNALGIILTDPRINVQHASEAGGPPYWVAGYQENP
jgi:hypothetical protein